MSDDPARPGSARRPGDATGETPRSEVALRRAASRERADEWALVLVAEGLAPIVRAESEGFVLALPRGQAARAQRALEVLAAYERENPRPVEPLEPPAASETRSSQAGTVAAAVLLLLFLVSGPADAQSPWFQAGSAEAGRILAGQWWRTATALTLHADLAHVAANAVVGALLVNAVCGAFGTGLGVAAVLIAGIGGNGINALVQTSPHSSVGASTAVFGALGLLCGAALARRRAPEPRTRRRRWLTSLGAGLGFVAMLGVGGARTDLWAHLFGLGVGFALGLPLARAGARMRQPAVQLALGALALGVLLGSWGLALRS